MRTDDPIRDFTVHDARQYQEEQQMVHCDICGYPIEDDHYYDILGEIHCEECLNKHHRKEIA